MRLVERLEIGNDAGVAGDDADRAANDEPAGAGEKPGDDRKGDEADEPPEPEVAEEIERNPGEHARHADRRDHRRQRFMFAGDAGERLRTTAAAMMASEASGTSWVAPIIPGTLERSAITAATTALANSEMPIPTGR